MSWSCLGLWRVSRGVQAIVCSSNSSSATSLSPLLSIFSSVSLGGGVCSVAWDDYWFLFNCSRDWRLVDSEARDGNWLKLIGEKVIVFSRLGEFVHCFSFSSDAASVAMEVETARGREPWGREDGTRRRSCSRNRPRRGCWEGGLPGEIRGDVEAEVVVSSSDVFFLCGMSIGAEPWRDAIFG